MNTLGTFAVLGQTVLGGVRRTTCASRNEGVRSTTCDHDDVPLKSEAGSGKVGLITTCSQSHQRATVRGPPGLSGQCRQTPS